MTAQAMHGAVRSRPQPAVKTRVGVSGYFISPAFSPRFSHRAYATRKTAPMTSGATTWALVEGKIVL